MAFTAIIGAVAYEQLVVWPQAYAGPPSSLTLFQGDYGLRAANFWSKIRPIVLGLLVIALIAPLADASPTITSQARRF